MKFYVKIENPSENESLAFKLDLIDEASSKFQPLEFLLNA